MGRWLFLVSAFFLISCAGLWKQEPISSAQIESRLDDLSANLKKAKIQILELQEQNLILRKRLGLPAKTEASLAKGFYHRLLYFYKKKDKENFFSTFSVLQQ
ncbi:MAG: hypothetical protein D6797_03660, partial [Bdellovibrio sp.]